ncbi:MAG TPA: phosphoribosylanthranilate isomerase [Limnochordales bacterium]
MTRVKICGLTTPEDARAAAAAGADMVGLVFAPSSRRVDVDTAVTVAAALPPFVLRVGVFVDSDYDTLVRIAEQVRLDMLQLHGSEDNRLMDRLRRRGWRVMKAVRVKDAASVAGIEDVAADALLLDAAVGTQAGGTGHTFDWRLACLAKERLREHGRAVPLVLAGGLRPENVEQALRQVEPDGVDVSSGVELAPGRKCPQRMREFVMKVRRFDVDRAKDLHRA